MFAFWSDRSPVFRFLVVFLALMLGFYLVWATSFFHDTVVQSAVRLNANLASGLLNLFGMGTTANGSMIESSEFTVNIKTGCDGIEGMALFSAAVLAFPAAWRQKIIGLVTGIGILFVVNLTRVVQLYLTGVYYPSLFEILHQNVWQIIFIILSLVLFGLWLASINRRINAPETPVASA